MRLLHTADWHLGHTLRDWARDHEHDLFLSWLLDTLEAEQVDALLVAGDIFDTTNPSAQAQLQWYRFLAQARRRLPDLQVVVIGGNHDAAGRLEAPNPILEALAIDVVGALPRGPVATPADRLLVPLRRRGEVRAWAAAVPFLRPADLPPVREVRAATEGAGPGGAEGGGASEGPAGDPLIEGVRQVYGGVINAIRARRGDDHAIVALGHAYFVGGALSEMSERKILGGNQHALPSDLFGPDVAYAALGHLHLAQPVGGREHVRYSGSPLPLSVAEATYPHQVVLVDLEGQGLRDVRSLRTPRAVEVLRFPAKGALPLDELLEALRKLDAPASVRPELWPFLDVAVEVTKPEPALVRRIEDALAGKGVRLVRIARQGRTVARSLGEALGVTSLRDLTPEQVFVELHQREHTTRPEGELLAAFAELVELAHRKR